MSIKAENYLSVIKQARGYYSDYPVYAQGGITNQVESWGATGDGATDDTNAILAALAALPSSGGTLEFGPGTFIISRAIAVTRSNITIQGQGVATQIYVKNNANIRAAIDITGTGVVEVKVRNLWINGNKANQTNGDGIYLKTPWATTDAQHLFEDLYITNCKNNGVEIGVSGDTRVCQFNRVHIKACDGNGFYLPWPGNTDSTFFGCITDTIALNGFYLGCANNRFIACKTFYCGSDGGNNHGYYILGYNNYFESCEAQDNYQSGFYSANEGDPTYGSRACTLANCIADSNNQTANASYGCGLQLNNCTNWQIIGGLYFTRPYPSFTQRIGILLSGTTTGTYTIGAQLTGNSSAQYSDTSSGTNYAMLNNGQASSNFAGRLIAPTLRVTTPSVPATAAASGTTGEIAWDTGFIYICTATNTWKRVAIATW